MLKMIKQFARLLYIHYIVARYGLDKIIAGTGWFIWLHWVSLLNPFNWRIDKRPRGIRVRLALQTLGPLFVKFGQNLATRRDLLPDDIADELAKLQDQVPPFSGHLAQRMIEQALQQPIHELFQEFDHTALAAASIAQVHAAKLMDGTHVVIKILRPKIELLIQRDIALMYRVARLIERYWPAARRLKPIAVVAEFEATLLDELDLGREAANASQLKRNFIHSSQLYVPTIFWPYTRKNILVMERIYGISIANLQALKNNKVNLKRLAENGVEIFFTQVFRDCFFHADMHPGNIFIDISNPEYPIYKAVDFGIMGSLSPLDQRYLANNLLAFFKRDYRRVAILHIESGWVPANTRIEQFEAAIRCVCEPIFERPLKEISFARLLLSLLQTAARFNMEIQPQLILLQKTLLNIEGLGRQLYPDLDLWQTAKPFLEKWVKQQTRPRMLLRRFCETMPLWLERLPEIPDLLYRNLVLNNSPTRNVATVDKKTTRSSWRTLGYGFILGIGATLLNFIIVYYLLRY